MPIAEEKALMGGEETCRLIVETAEEGICILDKNDRITFASNKLADLLGYIKEELLDKKIFELADSEHQKILKDALARRRKGQRETYTTQLQKKDGDFLWVIIAATPLFDKSGDYLGVLQLISDISPLKRMEEYLRDEKTKGDIYLDMMSHDIHNMNQVAIGYLELAREKLEAEGAIKQEEKNLIEKPIESLSRASKLIDSIKMLQHIRSGKIALETLNIGQTIHEIADEFTNIYGRDITFSFIQVEDCTVKANSLFKEIFRNLIGNAIKHSSGPLNIELIVKPVRYNKKSSCEVSVADNGPGIPDDIKEGLFERYKCRDAKTPGTGLGLYIVKSLVDSYHGKIWAEDRVPGDYSKGAKFIILLPKV